MLICVSNQPANFPLNVAIARPICQLCPAEQHIHGNRFNLLPNNGSNAIFDNFQGNVNIQYSPPVHDWMVLSAINSIHFRPELEKSSWSEPRMRTMMMMMMMTMIMMMLMMVMTMISDDVDDDDDDGGGDGYDDDDGGDDDDDDVDYDDDGGDDDDNDNGDVDDDYDVDCNDDDAAAAAAAAADDGDDEDDADDDDDDDDDGDDDDEVGDDYDVDYDHHPQSYCCLGREKTQWQADRSCSCLRSYWALTKSNGVFGFCLTFYSLLQKFKSIRFFRAATCLACLDIFLWKTIHSLSSPVVYLQMMVLILLMHKFSI